MQSCDFENFDITIRGASLPYGVTVRFQDQTADGTFNQDIGSSFWQDVLHDMRRTLYTPTPSPMRIAGATIFNDLFRGDVRDLWIAARASMERDTISGLRLRLALQPPPVAALPWETLYDPNRATIFAISNRIQLVRVEEEYRRLSARPAPHIQLPLRILIAAPEDPTGVIDAQREIDIVKRMLTTFGRNQIKIHTMTGRFTIVELRRRLSKIRPHVLHVLTHGKTDGIQFWQNGRPRTVSAAVLQTTLERTPWVRFVFLNACLAGQNSPHTPMAALGPQLLQAGIPAVLAMQFEIRDDVATEFAHFLYEALLTGGCPGAIDAAVTDARSSLYSLNTDELGYVTPVLWLNAPDGRIVIFEPNGKNRNGENGARDEEEEQAESEQNDNDNDQGEGEESDGDQENGETGDGGTGDGESPQEGDNGKDTENDDTENGDTGNSDHPEPPAHPPANAVDVIDVATESLWLAELKAEIKLMRVKPELTFVLATLRQILENLHNRLERLRNWDRAGRVQEYEEQTLAYRRQKAEALRLRRKLREAM